MGILKAAPVDAFRSGGGAGEITTEWQDLEAVFQIAESSTAGNLHINLGGVLPDNAVLEFQLGSLYLVTPNVTDPLDVDVGNIIFDHGEVCGWKKWSVESLEKPYNYYYDGASRRVFLNTKANPATMHDSIELPCDVT